MHQTFSDTGGGWWCTASVGCQQWALQQPENLKAMNGIVNPKKKVALQQLLPIFVTGFKKCRNQRDSLVYCISLITMDLLSSSLLNISVRGISAQTELPEKQEWEHHKKSFLRTNSLKFRAAEYFIFRFQPGCLRFSYVMKKKFIAKCYWANQ